MPVSSRSKKYGAWFDGKQGYFGPEVTPVDIPVPVGGWDAISPLAKMDPQYGPIMTNWVPRPGWIEMRGGYNVWAQGLGNSAVETLMPWLGPTNSKLFAATNGTLYDVSTYGAPVLSSSGYTNNRWKYTSFSPSLSSTYLIAVNGNDTPQIYNGTTWANWNVTLPNGLPITSITNIALFKQRIWITTNTTSVYYLGTGAIFGAFVEFPVGQYIRKGGVITAIGDWTVDGGSGPDDYIVLATNQGEYVVYKGTDPSNPNAFSLVATFIMPRIIGQRPFTKVGSELAIITMQGLLPLSQSLPYDPAGVRSVAFTNRIQNAMLESAQAYNGNFGWQLQSFPQQGFLVLNIPLSENSNQVQYVMNNYTGAWTQFTGWNANCFEVFNDSLYFGDNNGNVNLAYAGSLDLVTPILADAQFAFNSFDNPGRIKNMTMVRPIIVANGSIIPTISVDIDFDSSAPSAPISILQPTGAQWDVSKWDIGMWSGGTSITKSWQSVLALGSYLAVRIQVNFGGTSSSGSSGIGSVFDTGVFDSMIFDGNGATVASGQLVPTLQLNAMEGIVQAGSFV